MTTRKQVEAEAAELYPMPAPSRAVHVRAKTISAEQVEAAAEAFHNAIGPEDDEGPMYWWHELSEYVRKLSRHDMRVAFRVAGFLIEGDDDA